MHLPSAAFTPSQELIPEQPLVGVLQANRCLGVSFPEDRIHDVNWASLSLRYSPSSPEFLGIPQITKVSLLCTHFMLSD